MAVVIVPISHSSRALLATAPGWQETPIPSGQRVARHYHDFQATYFTFGVPTMQVGDEELSLPAAAMVIVPHGVVHGWLGPQEGVAIVGHFHEAHGDHQTERVEEAVESIARISTR